MDDGFEAVYERYGRSIHAYVARLTGDASGAEEICQETFVRYLAHEEALKGRNGALAPWLYRVATNLGLDRLRRRRPLPLTMEPPAGPAPREAALEREDLEAHVKAEIERLNPPLRAPFLLHAHHGLTFPQVAGVLGISERGAKDRYRRARDTLAKRLSHLIEEDLR